MSNDSKDERTPDPEGGFLYGGLAMAGPVEELAAIAERKVRTHLNLGETERTELLSVAHELARARLEAALASPKSRSAG